MKRITFIIMALILTSAIYSSVRNTWKWAGDFNGLLILVSLPDKERSYNPYSKDFYWVSQDMALTILKSKSYPYERCSGLSQKLGGCDQPRIEYTGRFVGMVDDDTESKIFELLDYLIERNEPVNAYSSEGFTALQSAILGNSPKLASLLLQSGADPYLLIKRNGNLEGKNSIEFIDTLYAKNPEKFSELKASIYEEMSNKSSKKNAASDASS